MPGRTSLSLERKLPLLISVLLVALAVGLTWAGYAEVRQASEMRGIGRLQRLATQLAEFAGANTGQRFARLRRVAADSAVIAHLTGRGDDPASEARAVAALDDLALSGTDTAIVAELRGVGEARRVATRPELARDDEPVAVLIRTLSRGQPAVGELYRRGDSAYFWVGAPVTGNGRILGYVLQRRSLRAAARLEHQMRGLIGSDNVSIHFASDSGAIWSGLGGTAVPVPTVERRDDEPPNMIHYSRGDTAYVAVYAGVPSTPLRVLAEMPHGTLLERPTMFLRRSIVVALAMLVIGGLAAWVLSRHITRPLRELTTAAEALSTGDYAQRARVARRDETGRLADAFNTMAVQVQRSHDDLEQQIAESRTLAGRLDEANRAKADFLATMSHELRTPLNAIGGYVDLLEMGVRGPITAEQRHDLERVRYNQRHLLTLIGNILDFTRLDAQKMSYELGDVRADRAASEILTAVAPLLEEKALRRECIGCDRRLLVRADRGRLEQILLNLLSNAVRFTPAGGTVTLTLEPRGDQVAVVVSDTGIGVPEDKLAAIFEPFVQIDSGLTRTVGGTGLGLTISRELARGMGGDLTAANRPDGGARFTLTLPAGGERGCEPTAISRQPTADSPQPPVISH